MTYTNIMYASKLKIGDQIRITGIPEGCERRHYLHKETKEVYKKIVERGRPVRISRIDEDGIRWYTVRFKEDGAWVYHDLCVAESDTNWNFVEKRK